MKVITIAREYAAGGHTIGRKVDERLGVELYDRDILLKAAKESGLDLNEIISEEEKLSKVEAFIHAITPVAFDMKDAIYEYESRAIVELAKKGPCVILGRCASAILRKEGIDCVSVYLHAEEKDRAERASELLGVTDKVALHRAIHKIDVARRAYYETYTGGKWGAPSESTISIDTGNVSVETSVNIICAIANDGVKEE